MADKDKAAEEEHRQHAAEQPHPEDVCLLPAGGQMEATQGFAIALIIGVVIGTYSSIYIASNVILYMNVTREDLMIPIKEGSELDDIP